MVFICVVYGIIVIGVVDGVWSIGFWSIGFWSIGFWSIGFSILFIGLLRLLGLLGLLVLQFKMVGVSLVASLSLSNCCKRDSNVWVLLLTFSFFLRGTGIFLDLDYLSYYYSCRIYS